MPYFATKDHTALYYEVWGEGRPVVFVHGWSGSHEHAHNIIKRLKNEYKLICYSHRGHGPSDCPDRGYTINQLAWDLHELINYLDLHDFILVGHSMGAYTLYEYIKLFGCEDINRIVLLDMSPKVLCDEEWKFGAYGVYDAKGLAEDLALCAQDAGSFLFEFWKRMFPEFAKIPDSMRDYVAPSLMQHNHALPLLALWYSMFTSDYRDVIPKINVPVLYILPEIPIYPRGAAEFIRDNASAPVTIKLFEGCTHMSNVEKPEETALVFNEFFKTEF
ncbi:MAG: alpha/beta hydrolase [Firmicutes bacterium]|nr:alpha/beta hydrolase [Bacillota bacterium]